MAKRMKKIGSCIVISVILMCVISGTVFAVDSGDNTTLASNYSNETVFVDEETLDVKFEGTVISPPSFSYAPYYCICEARIDRIISDPYNTLLEVQKEGSNVAIVYSTGEGSCGTYESVEKGDEIKVYGQLLTATIWPPWVSVCGKSSYYLEKIEKDTCDVTFEGVVTEISDKLDSTWYDAKIQVTNVISDPSHTLNYDNVVTVYRANEDAYQEEVEVGDSVEVCAEYNSEYIDYGYALRYYNHYIEKIDEEKTGSLTVTIYPSEVRSDARWRLTSGTLSTVEIDDTSWHSRGDMIANIPLDYYTIQSNEVSGWTKPSDKGVTITEGSNYQSGTYTQETGSLTVTIYPSEVRSDARWKLTSGPDTNWHSSGYTITDIPVGYYTIRFSDVSGWTKPDDIPISIAEGSNYQSGWYDVSIPTCDNPPEVYFDKLTYYEGDTILATVSTTHSSVYYYIYGCDDVLYYGGDASNGATISYTIPKTDASTCCNWRICFSWDEDYYGTLELGEGGNVTAESYQCGPECYYFEVCPPVAYLEQIWIEGPDGLNVGETEQWQAHGSYSDGSQKELTDQVTWTVDPSDVLLNEGIGGIFTGLKGGDATLKVSYGTLSATKKVTVVKREVWFQGTVTAVVSDATGLGGWWPVITVRVEKTNASSVEVGGTVEVLYNGPPSADLWNLPKGTCEKVDIGDKVEVFGQCLGDSTRCEAIWLFGSSSYYLMKIDEEKTGSLTVTIEPSEVRSDAKWKLTSGPDTRWHSSGDKIQNIPVGSNKILFNDISGWTKPEDISIAITEGSNSDEGRYRPELYLEKIRIEGPDELNVGETEQWQAYGSYSNGSQKELDQVTWTVDPSDVLLHDGNGKFTGLKGGDATLKIAYEGKTATKKVTVLEKASSELEEKYRQHLINTSKFYNDYSINVLTHEGWWLKNIDAAKAGMEETYMWGFKSIITAPITLYLSGLNPWAAVAMREYGIYSNLDFGIDTLTGLTKTYTLKDITQMVKNTNPKFLRKDLDDLRSNTDQLILAFENGEKVTSLLSDRREKLAYTYTDLCTYDQEAFDYIKKQPKFISNSISDYRMFHQHTSMLATTLAMDFILTTACEKYYSDKSELNYNIAKEAGCGFVVQRLDDNIGTRVHFFGYFNAKGDIDKYKLSMPKDFTFVQVIGDKNILFILEDSDGYLVDTTRGNGKIQYLDIKYPDAAGEYILTVECYDHAGPYEIQIQLCFYPPLSSNLYPKIEPLSADEGGLKYLSDITTLALECPVNATITDRDGRTISDDGTNEIPGADMFITEDTKIFYLPADLTYTTEIDAYDTGTFNFTRVSPVGNDISITKFENIPITSSTKASVDIEPGVTDYTMSIDYNGDGTTDEEKSPDVNETIIASPNEYIFDTRASANTYPSISGTHTGTITPNQNITVQKLYTYPCAGTGGHTESVRIYGDEIDESASWNGYAEDGHTLTFNSSFTLEEGKTYNYVIITGSYPQIHHTEALQTENGWINCTEFVDANGNEYKDWIPAITLYG